MNYSMEMRKTLQNTDHLTIRQAEVSEIITETTVLENGKEIQKMIEDGETIEVKCHFCNSAYHYTVEDLKAIIKRSK